MKNAILMVLLMILFIITGCRDVDDEVYGFEDMFNEDGQYVGFKDASDRWSVDDSKKAGYFTLLDGDIVAGEDTWTAFCERATSGESAYVRMVSFFTMPSSGPYYTDIYYEEGYYYHFDSTAQSNEADPYEHLLHLEGAFGNPKQPSAVTVLTNNENLTFDDYMKSLYSSTFIGLEEPWQRTQLLMFN